MARKKTREIVHGNATYTWRCTKLNQSYVMLKIWKEKGSHSLRVRFRFDDPWFHFPEMALGQEGKVEATFQTIPITPFAVRTAIVAANDKGWGNSLDLAWMDGNFVIVTDASLVPEDRYGDNTGKAQRPPTATSEPRE